MSGYSVDLPKRSGKCSYEGAKEMGIAVAERTIVTVNTYGKLRTMKVSLPRVKFLEPQEGAQ